MRNINDITIKISMWFDHCSRNKPEQDPIRSETGDINKSLLDNDLNGWRIDLRHRGTSNNTLVVSSIIIKQNCLLVIQYILIQDVELEDINKSRPEGYALCNKVNQNFKLNLPFEAPAAINPCWPTQFHRSSNCNNHPSQV